MNVAHKNSLPYFIIDTSAWIAYFCFKFDPNRLHSDALKSELEETSENVKALIDGHGREHIILMPTCIYAEIMGTIRGKGNTPHDRKELVLEVSRFLDSLDLLPADLDVPIAKGAAHYVCDFELKGIDAAIIATATYWEADYLFTLDEKLIKIGTKIPELSIETPPPSNTLPIP